LTYLDDERALEVAIGGREKKFKAVNRIDIDGLKHDFNDWKHQASENFLTPYETTQYGYGPGGKLVTQAAAIVVAIALGAGLSYGFISLNRGYDDERTWNAAAADGTVKPLDDYRQKYPRGRHVAEASSKIESVLKSLKDDYLAHADKYADPKAVSAFSSFLDHLSKNPHTTVYVRIAETREFDDAVVDKIKKLGISAYTYEQALPSSKVEDRKVLLLQKFKEAFGERLKNVDINFEQTDDQPADAPLIDVVCRMKSKDGYYTFFTYSGGPSQVGYYPMTNFVFNFSFSPGSGIEPFQINFENSPPVLRSQAFKAENSENYSFDEVLFGLATDNFRNYIESKFGFISPAST
jgi:hypothetical protein